MKKIIVPTVVIACFMAIYNILIFCLVKTFTPNIWTGYGFIMAGFVIMLLSFVLVNATNKQGEVTGLPIKTLSVYYFIAMAVVANVLMFLNISFIAVFLPLVIISLIFLAVYIPAITKLFSKN